MVAHTAHVFIELLIFLVPLIIVIALMRFRKGEEEQEEKGSDDS